MPITNRLSMITGSIPVLFAFHLCFWVFGAQAGYMIDAYRLAQYDVDGVSLGSRSARLSQYATMNTEGAKLFRSIVIIPFSQAKDSIITELLQNQNIISGILFVLPKNFDNGALSTKDMDDFVELEKSLLGMSIPVPVYFAFNDDNIAEMVVDIEDSLKKGKVPSASNGGYMMVVKGADPKPVQSPLVINYEGWLPGSEGGRPGSTKSPTIVINAHYDTFSVAPFMSGGSGSNGSGTLGLLSLVRMFSLLYADETTRPSYNIIFLLTGGGNLDFAGLKLWLKTANTRLTDTIELVINLDTLSGWGTHKSGELYLHHSKPKSKDAVASEWYDLFAKAASREKLTLNEAHKKINLGSKAMDWEHEHVAQFHMLSVTISGRKTPGPPTLLDQANLVDFASIARASRMVAEAISMKLFDKNSEGVQLFANGSSYHVDTTFMQSWAKAMENHVHVTPYMTEKSPLGLAFKNHMDKYITAKVSKFNLEKTYTFYNAGSQQINIYKTGMHTG